MNFEARLRTENLRRAFLALSLGALVACSTRNDPPPDDAEARRVADEALSVFVDSWNRAAAGDPEAPADYGAQYWPDAELVDPSGLVWDGRPAIVQMHVDLWNTAFKGSVVEGTVRRTRPLSPSVLIADFDMRLALSGGPAPGDGSGGAVFETHLKHVMEKRDGSWKVVAAQNTFESAPPPAR